MNVDEFVILATGVDVVNNVSDPTPTVIEDGVWIQRANGKNNVYIEYQNDWVEVL